VSCTHRLRSLGAALVLGALTGALVLTGCSAGQITGTSTQVGNSGGGDVSSGAITVGNARLEVETVEGRGAFPVGGSAPLSMRITNTGAEADRLVSASSPVTSSVEVSGARDIPGGHVLVVESRPVGPAAEPTGEPEATPTPEPAPATGGERVAQIVLTGLREELRTGLTYDVVLTFVRAGEIRVPVPVGPADTEPRRGELGSE
jgi:hypothetical protein